MLVKGKPGKNFNFNLLTHYAWPLAGPNYLANALMEHFLEGIVLLRHWYINPNEKSNK